MIGHDLQEGILTAGFRGEPDVMLTESFAEALGALLDSAADPAVRVLVLRSERKSFCAGAGPDHLLSWAGADGGNLIVQDDTAWDGLFTRLEKLPVPVIAEIGGAALGVGLGLALACDIRIVTPEAVLGAPEVRFGLLPAGGTVRRILRQAGPTVARDLLMCGRILKGEAAHAAGLADDCVPASALRDRTVRQAEMMAALDPAAVAAAKRAIRQVGDNPDRSGDDLRHLVSRSVTQEALTTLTRRVAGATINQGH